MRKYSIAATVAAVSMMSVAAIAADLPEPPPTVYIPPPIYPEVGPGGLYLRGSLAIAAVSAADLECACEKSDVTGFKAGYGFGLGLGYEFGSGLRAEIAVDHLQFKNITAENGKYGNFRATIAMAKIYYDFDISGGASGGYGYGAGGYGGSIAGGGSASGGGAITPYIGAGIGFAKINGDFYDPCECLIATADSNTWAASVEAGVSYDLGGGVKTDFGYEFLYLNEIEGLGAGVNGGYDITAHGVFAHQIKASLRVAIN